MTATPMLFFSLASTPQLPQPQDFACSLLLMPLSSTNSLIAQASVTTLAQDKNTRYSWGLSFQAVTICRSGTIMQPRRMATPLNGSNYVPTLSPKYYTKPGPARVVMERLISPISTTMITIMVLLRAKSLKSLLPKSRMLSTRMVKATPLQSPRQPHKNAPSSATSEHSMLVQLRKWSSLTMGMQIILQFIIRWISYRPVRNETAMMMTNFQSRRAYPNVSSVVVLQFRFVPVVGVSAASGCFQFCVSICSCSTSPSSFILPTRKLPRTANPPATPNPIIAVLLKFRVTCSGNKCI